MTLSADCVNTKSGNGLNLTPLPVIEALHEVFPRIDLDPASCRLANQDIDASHYFGVALDGLSRHWRAEYLWLNPPGKTISQGKERKAAAWANKLLEEYVKGNVDNAIYLCYRAGSLGSLGNLLNSAARVCLTTNLSVSSAVNGSGRFAFDTIDDGDRHPETANTQSSAFILLTDRRSITEQFQEQFSQFGIVLKP